ncbi:MAG TPA: hypothetical protein IAB39_04765 [Candidatus Onthovicinus excrementipullorum]|nr:hypothetical protein [Candidatus Onthovicinus excrementipullorum]
MDQEKSREKGALRRGFREHPVKVSLIILFPALVILLAIAGIIVWCVMADPPVKAKETVPLSGQVIEENDVRLIGHRGFSAVAPENTIPAFEEAGKAGFWGAELDVHRTKDGKWVVMHDDNLSRMTRKVDSVASHNSDELLAVDINNGANIDQYSGAKIPLLSDMLAVCEQYDMTPVIEVKSSVKGELNDLIEVVDEAGFKNQAIYISFSQEHTKALRALVPGARVFYLSSDITDEAVNFCLENNVGLDFDARRENNTPELIQSVMDQGIQCAAWTVDDLELCEDLIDLGVQYITTNCIYPD